MLRDIVFRSHLDVFSRVLLGHPSVGVEPMTVGTPGELGSTVANMAHEPLGYLSGPFRGSQEQWPSVGKGSVAIVITLKRLT